MILTNAWYSSICSLFLFITFFPLFLVSLIQHSFGSRLCFPLRWRISETKIADSPERPTKTKKFGGSFQYKTKFNTTWFSQENLKNHKDVITNSKFGEFYFYFKNKICTKDVLCIHDIANDLVRHYSENDIINDIMRK